LTDGDGGGSGDQEYEKILERKEEMSTLKKNNRKTGSGESLANFQAKESTPAVQHECPFDNDL
jgi:hypothetical protein